jgi:uncharacterized cofD-like protein
MEAFEHELTGVRVAALGGGHGLAAALRAARTYASHVTGIVSVADDGGSSGRLTAGLGIPPPGDIRRCLLALTPDRSVWSDIFSYRFRGEPGPVISDRAIDIEGHSLGNLIIAALTDLAGDFGRAVEWAGTLLGAAGRVLPVADHPLELSAVVGGRPVTGQAAITKTRGGVEEITLGPPDVSATPEAIDVIHSADQILIGPGSLFTSIIPALKVPGVAEAIDQAPGRVVYILNLTTQDAETLDLDGGEHLEAVRTHGGVERPCTVLSHAPDVEVPLPITPVSLPPGFTSGGWEVARGDVSNIENGWPVHDSIKLGRVLSDLL